MVISALPRQLALLLVVLFGWTFAAEAAVTARVDTQSVDLNESFELTVSVDSHIDAEPDLSVLETDFYVGQFSYITNSSFINGEISRSRVWSVPLRPKRTGDLTIPSIRIGNENSEPIRLVVNEPTELPPGEADVFIVSEVDQPEAYVQSQVLYRIKVYRAVQVRQPTLRPLSITGAEALTETAGEERSYEAILGGRAYQVNEQVLAIYPQESGEISIAPARFEARVLRNGRITGRKVFDSDAHTITVKPTPPPPPAYPDAAWLPARDLTLEEEWSRDLERIDAGEPLTRRITVAALGQLETQIPALEPPTIDGMNVYADKPELSRRYEAGGIRGVRKDQYALIGVRGGAVEVPELVVPWWDIEAGEWREARLPARTINVRATEALMPAPEVEVADVAADNTVVTAADTPAATPVNRGFWKPAAQLLGLAWLLTLLMWWLSSSRGKRRTRVAEPPPIYKQQAKFVKAARKAATAGDAAAVKSALVEWGRLEWPDDAPRSVGEFSERVAEPLAGCLRELSMASYGAADTDWDGAALSQALRKITPRTDASPTSATADPLPPLMPPAR